MQIDDHYCEAARPKRKTPAAGLQATVEKKVATVDPYVGPGCPADLVQIAPGYVSSDLRKKMVKGAKSGMTFYGRQYRKPFELFLTEATCALEHHSLYKHLRKAHLIPAITTFNLEGVVCEIRKPNEEAFNPLRDGDPDDARLRLWAKLSYK